MPRLVLVRRKRRRVPQKLKNNYHSLMAEIDSRAILIAVSKKRSLQQIQVLYDLGQRDFGENRIEDLEEKSLALDKLNINWHFIGNLQSKKIPKLLAIKNLTHIHSVDRDKLIKILGEQKCSAEIFLQMNISGEAEKSGYKNLSELNHAFELANTLGLKVKGLMGMAGIRVEDQQESADRQFNALQQARDEIDPKLELSIGMSNDYSIALKNDAKYLRIGSLLFS